MNALDIAADAMHDEERVVARVLAHRDTITRDDYDTALAAALAGEAPR